MRELILTEADANRRLDKYLMQYLNNAPRSFLYKLLRTKRVKYNGKRAVGSEITASGDRITFYLSDAVLDSCMTERTVIRTAPAPDIVYEDEHVLILQKPAGLLTHDANDANHHERDTLLTRALYYLQRTGAYDVSRTATFTPALCNRLDRNTSGLVVCGKTLAALQAFNALFAARGVDKEYIAVVHGTLTGSGTLTGYLTKNQKANIVQITTASESPDAVEVITAYETVQHNRQYTLLRVKPLTGRSHQIRAHLAGIGHPLAGDVKYGGKPTGFAPGQLLHCQKLTLTNPMDETAYPTCIPYPIGRSWQGPLPEGLTLCIREWFNL